jgi:hypothetical protein
LPSVTFVTAFKNERLVQSRGPNRSVITDRLQKKPLGPDPDMRGSALTQVGVCTLGEYENSGHAPTVQAPR